jgi:hypothetical protein
MATKTRPSRKPPGEDLVVTVANQDRQIQVLIDRVEELRKERDVLGLKVRVQMEDIARHKDAGESLSEEVFRLKYVIARMEGWQDCAREIFGANPMFREVDAA